jgi:manganese/zinc/iron transport system substrate-binding protein
MMKRYLEVVIVLCGMASLAGCGNPANSLSAHSGANGGGAKPSGAKFTIVTTCGMVTDLVRQVAGDRATVIGLMHEGVDPHLYKPTRNDVKRLMEADVVFYSGLMLEGRMADTFSKIGRQGKPVYAVTEGLDESRLREPPEFAGHWDPHVWMNAALWSDCAAFVARSLGDFDPEHREQYAHNADAYRAQLAELDAYVHRIIASIPEQQRLLITAHDAFGYFSEAYNIPVLSAQGLSTESEASVDDINRLVDTIVSRQVRAIFVESSVPKDNIQAIVEGAADRGWQVAIGGELFSDAMGKANTYEGTYIGMIDHNATLIARALGGNPPPSGLHGKLAVEE